MGKSTPLKLEREQEDSLVCCLKQVCMRIMRNTEYTVIFDNAAKQVKKSPRGNEFSKI